jgi:hypothetical protein
MDYLFLNGFHTPEIEEELKASSIYPLIREIVFKYELRVLKRMDSWWFLCHKNGTVLGKASTRMNDDNKLEYQYYSPYLLKARGSDSNDKHTARSTKISVLMASLKRLDAIPNQDTATRNKLLPALKNSMSIARRSLGNSNKHVNVSANTVHALLACFFNEDPNSLGLSISEKECKDLFDKLNEADRVRGMKEQLVMDLFYSPFYVVSVDGFNDVSVGKLKVTEIKGEEPVYEIIEPLRRYKNIMEDYPALVPILTMVKVAYESNVKLAGGYIPITDEYNAPLSATFSYDRALSSYDSIFMVTPC